MERFKTNIKLIRNRFRAIENHFIFSSDNISKENICKSYSHKALIKRPYIKPKNNANDKNKNINKIKNGNQLDQIGNDDLIFNNDKLITNIKIDNIEEFNQKGLNYINDEENKDMSLKTVRKISPKKSNLSPTGEGKNKRLQKAQSPKNRKKILFNNINNNDILHLDCVKNQNQNLNSSKVGSAKSFIKNKNIIQTNRVKNINQFINKPNETNFIESNHKKVIMTPVIIKQSPSKMTYHKSFNKINLKFANPNSSPIDFNDNFNLSPVPGTGAHNSSRGKSTSNNKSSIHFPNKSVVKNMDKLFKELQKIFGDKVQLNDDLYQNMSDSDKKNTINFLLDSLKEIYSINKVALSKNDGYKEIADSKEKQLKEAKNEIKELKNDNAKLNKIIKTNIQMNRKLSQNIDNLKSQLEKEKKNKNKEMQTKGKSANKTVRSNNKIKYRNDSGGLSVTSSKKMKGNMSQDRFRKTSDFINRKKGIDNNKSIDKKNNKKKINGNTKEKNSNNINSIKADENKDNPNNNNNKDLLNDSIEPIISDMNINNDINLVENLNIDKNDSEVDNDENNNNNENQ